MRRLLVESAGPRTTVEDRGRRRVGRFGIPPGGAFDAAALAEANRAVGNDPDRAGLEATLAGPSLRNVGREPVAIAIVGGSLLSESGEAAAHLLLRPGELVGTMPLHGARAWIAVAGGVAVPPVLDSRSTCLSASFGGFDGRPLAAGDVLPIGAPSSPDPGPEPPARECPSAVPSSRVPFAELRLVRGPSADLWPLDPVGLLGSTLWTVSGDSDRTGVRLRPLDPAIAPHLGGVAGIPPQGTVLGAVQAPPDGSAIVLGPDRPVTGGYAMPAIVVSSDIGVVARLRPGARVRFVAARLALSRTA